MILVLVSRENRENRGAAKASGAAKCKRDAGYCQLLLGDEPWR
jgi:hypothetical protein